MTNTDVSVQPMVHGQASTKDPAVSVVTQGPAAPADPDGPDGPDGPAGRPTPTEVVESLTGWDELAVKRASGQTITQLAQDEVHLLRCMAAVVIARRDGVKIELAYRSAMDQTQREVDGLFAEEPNDVLPDEPDSTVGKGDSQPAPPPPSSPNGASPQASQPPSIESSPV